MKSPDVTIRTFFLDATKGILLILEGLTVENENRRIFSNQERRRETSI